jgi:hypothetical protein
MQKMLNLDFPNKIELESGLSPSYKEKIEVKVELGVKNDSSIIKKGRLRRGTIVMKNQPSSNTKEFTPFNIIS